MPDQLDTFLQSLVPTPERPLLGQTVLAVEDSRFACEALRLLCLRSGARIRRADTLKSAARHLATYRPSILIVDLGLPDGPGAKLIREMSGACPRIPAIIAISGDDGARGTALQAGADAFLEKPITSLGKFQSTILAALPPEERPAGLGVVPNVDVSPDRLAFRDDLAHVASLLDGEASEDTMRYVRQFVGSIATTSDDAELRDAARALGPGGTAQERATLKALIDERLKSEAVFEA